MSGHYRFVSNLRREAQKTPTEFVADNLEIVSACDSIQRKTREYMRKLEVRDNKISATLSRRPPEDRVNFFRLRAQAPRKIVGNNCQYRRW